MQDWPKEGVVYVVETQDTVFFSLRKLDAVFKHCEYKFKDKVRYRELNAAEHTPPHGKLLVIL